MSKQDKQDRILTATTWLVMAGFLIVNAINHSLPHEIVKCATMWLIVGTHAVLH